MEVFTQNNHPSQYKLLPLSNSNVALKRVRELFRNLLHQNHPPLPFPHSAFVGPLGALASAEMVRHSWAAKPATPRR